MSRDQTINITSAVLLLVGLVTILLPVAFASAREELLTTMTQALLLLMAGWLLYKRQKLAIVILVISAVFYLVNGWYTAYTNNLSVSALRPAFYWSFALRVLLVVFVFFLLSRIPSSTQR